MKTSREEREFHQLATTTLFVGSLVMMWAEAAGWLVMLIAFNLLAGSVASGLSVTRGWHRFFVAPLLANPTLEESQAYLRADAVYGTLAFAGSVFVITGVAPIGWMIVGLCALGICLDSLGGLNPIRRVIDAMRM
ncbi:MAG: hypothetical protein CL790_07220 [Chloroflexi bacterium]|nr:hypothetical protein [Chloroflexota bacterium]HCU73534.1 hypothetical protein [Chloroflexota bacterium]